MSGETKPGQPDMLTMPEKSSEETREREIHGRTYDWGEKNMRMEDYSIGWACKDCYGANVTDDLEKLVIGVGVPSFTRNDAQDEYAAICECPECFSHFWFHISEITAKNLKLSYDAGLLKVKPKLK